MIPPDILLMMDLLCILWVLGRVLYVYCSRRRERRARPK